MSVDFTQNEKFMKRWGQYFDHADMNKNGYIDIDEMLKLSDNLVENSNATPEQVTTMLESLRLFWGAAGLVPGKKMNKEEFLKGSSLFVRAELMRRASGEETFQKRVSKAMFDVIDANNDGTLSLPELTAFLKAWNHDENTAAVMFAIIDANKNGKIEVEEFIESQHKFWYTPDDESMKCLFGDDFE